jgi:septum formation protein
MTTHPRPLVLASTSRYRRALLEGLGVAHVAAAPAFDEDHAVDLAPAEMASAFARGKAESLRGAFADAYIVGSDQIAEIEGRILTKPGDSEAAVEQLMAQAGRTHRLLSAVAVLDAASGRLAERLVVHELRMRPLTRAQAEAYVARDAPLDCAGSYRIEAGGIALFTQMRGDDHSAIIGLPIAALGDCLEELGDDWLGRVL